MNFSRNIQGNQMSVALAGKFTFPDNQVFRELLNEAARLSQPALEFDFDQVDFIDSAALGMLLVARDEVLKQGGHVTLKRPRGQVKKMFDISRFSALFTVID